MGARKSTAKASRSTEVWPGSIAADAAIVLVAALLVRLVYAAEVADCPLYQMPTMDSGYYYALARQFANGQWTHPVGLPYWQPPFYSMLLALWMDIASTSVTKAKFAGLVLGSVNCALTMMLGRRVFGRTVGLIAGLAATLYGPMIYFDGELLTPTLQIFLNLSGMLVLLLAAEKISAPLFAAAGGLFGLSIITRPDAAVFAVAAALWAATGIRKNVTPGRLAGSLALLALFAAIPVIPLAVRNAKVGKDTALISTNGGINFYIGNNPDYERTVEIRPGPEWDALQRMPLVDNPNASSSEQSDWFYRRSFEFIREHPAEWAGIMLKKGVVYLTAVESRRDQDLYFYRDYSILYSALLFKTRWFAFPLGVVLPLAVFGLAVAKRQRDSDLLIWYLVSMLAVTAAFFVCARYRITAVPVMLIFAGSGAARIWQTAKERQWKRFILPVAATAIVLVISNANLYGVDKRQDLIQADAHYSVAEVLCNRSQFAAAAAECVKSLKLNPEFSAARLNYSRILSALGNSQEAERQLLTCLKLDPDYAAAHSAFGELLAKKGSTADSARHFVSAGRLDPAFTERTMIFGKEAFKNQDYPAAEAAMRAVVTLKPNDAEARCGLGLVLLNRAKPAEAIVHLREATRIRPELPGNFIALGTAYLRDGQTAAAKEAFDKAIAIGPADKMRAVVQRLEKENASR